MTDEFKTPKAPSEGLFKDKGSKFFGYIFPIKNENEVKAHLENLKSLHPKARHHCFAYKLGIDENNFRANDDGEPSGTAGKPILNTLHSFELSDTLAVVVRYFGGTLLGVPGLINAYKEATKEAILAAEIESKTINSLIKISHDFDQTNAVMIMCRKLQLNIKEQTYDSRCGLIVEVRNSYIEKIKEELTDFWNIEIEII
ncbi:MAG: YigZ family protein [Cytophagaceae bacterium]|nr:YigZ family protein [Cytophagaceae bacterium]MBL0302742.1 YigZ family protein [Cytophagaceae bacterium]MBL0325564.1 YigZ family protein [Cytophagaceae bacterium]